MTKIQGELKTSLSFPKHFKFRLLELKFFIAVFVDSAKTNVFNLAIEFEASKIAAGGSLGH